ncbi:30S ribosomal protein S17 [Rhodovulum kholense]|uniref:30S ribosomal protein S17 n=1 Tax=Rhodovulum kholense TaxID=453584 RepID=UPI001C0134B7|nr:30S ribosomal protein S17 [Rhodovulum kholense]
MIHNLSERERKLSDRIFDVVSSSEGSYKLSDLDVSEIKSLMGELRKNSHSAISPNEYKWCVDSYEKWRYFLVGNGFYVPFVRLKRPLAIDESSRPPRTSEEILKECKNGKPVDGSMGGRVIVGRAVRDSFDKTGKICVESRKRDSLTGKVVKRRKTFLVHDEGNEAAEGDFVTAAECRPISKKKRFVLLSVSPIRPGEWKI